MTADRRSRLWMVCLVFGIGLMLALAGCTSTTDTGETADTPPMNNSETGDSETDTESGTGGDEATDALAQSHRAALEDIETATTEIRVALDTDYGTVFFNSTAEIDLATEAVRQHTLYEGHTAEGLIQTTFAEVESYATPAATYKRTDSDFRNETTYNDTAEDGEWGTESVTEYLQTDIIGSADENIVWTRTGTEQFDGTETYRYVAEGASEFDGFHENVTALLDGETTESGEQNFSLGQNTTLTVTEMNATMLVSPDGVVRYFSYYLNGTVDGEQVSLTIEFWTTDLGTTTVSEPDWTSEAEREADEQS